MTPGLLRALSILSVIETVTVVVLFVNVVTFDDRGLAALLGPVHGAFYLAVVVTAVLGRGFSLRTRVQALIPVLSGPLTYRNVARERRRHNSEPRDT